MNLSAFQPAADAPHFLPTSGESSSLSAPPHSIPTTPILRQKRMTHHLYTTSSQTPPVMQIQNMTRRIDVSFHPPTSHPPSLLFHSHAFPHDGPFPSYFFLVHFLVFIHTAQRYVPVPPSLSCKSITFVSCLLIFACLCHGYLRRRCILL